MTIKKLYPKKKGKKNLKLVAKKVPTNKGRKNLSSAAVFEKIIPVD